jgi:hypothetical protein
MRLGCLFSGESLSLRREPHTVDSIDLAIERNLVSAVDRSGIAANSYYAIRWRWLAYPASDEPQQSYTPS